MKGNISSF